MQPYEVVIRPLVTEQSMKESEKGKYTFLVHRRANKGDVRRAVESVFHVDVTAVVTTTVKGRTKRVGKRRNEVTESPFKKAIVQLKEGQTLGGAETSVETGAAKTKDKKDVAKKGGVASLLSGRFKKGTAEKVEGSTREG